MYGDGLRGDSWGIRWCSLRLQCFLRRWWCWLGRQWCLPPSPALLPSLLHLLPSSLYCILDREWVPLSQLFLMSKAHRTPIKHRRYIAKVFMLNYISRWGAAGIHTGHSELTEKGDKSFFCTLSRGIQPHPSAQLFITIASTRTEQCGELTRAWGERGVAGARVETGHGFG